MASAIQRPLQRALTLIGVGLIGSSLSGCGTAWKQRIGLDWIRPLPATPYRRSAMDLAQPPFNQGKTSLLKRWIGSVRQWCGSIR